MKLHWTERNIKTYLFRIVADFIDQIENKMESLPISQDEFAKKLGLSKGRVSQILNRRGNITLKTIIHCARTLGMKVSMVAYEDDDPRNKKGPINPEVFRICWEKSGKPRDLWDTQNVLAIQNDFAANITFGGRLDDFKLFDERKSSSANVATGPGFFAIGRFVGNQETFEDDKRLPS